MRARAPAAGGLAPRREGPSHSGRSFGSTSCLHGSASRWHFCFLTRPVFPVVAEEVRAAPTFCVPAGGRTLGAAHTSRTCRYRFSGLPARPTAAAHVRVHRVPDSSCCQSLLFVFLSNDRFRVCPAYFILFSIFLLVPLCTFWPH